jgi:hypothetical protein
VHAKKIEKQFFILTDLPACTPFQIRKKMLPFTASASSKVFSGQFLHENSA